MNAVTEVVTRALVRDAHVPVGGHDLVRFAVVTLDNGQDHRRPTTFGPGGLHALEAALAGLEQRAARGEIDAVAVTGKPSVFCVGADLSLLSGIDGADDARAIGTAGHRAFGRLDSLGVPTFALINGPAMGGGLELALHCDHRVVASSVRSLSLPEVSLGLVPAWGGAWLLPHLVGPDAAVRVIVENPLNRNRQLDAAEAVRLGLADTVLQPADFVADALRWAAEVVRGRTAVHRPEIRRDAGAWNAAVARGRAFAYARVHGTAPAADLALDLIEAARTCDRAVGFAAEDAALARLIPSPETRASLYAFDLVQRRAKRPAGAPDPALARPVTKLGIVGAGLMATQIAVLAAGRLGVPVVLRDQDPERVAAGLRSVSGQVDDLVARGRFDADKANRVRALITADVEWSVFADCDLVIEAVYEELDVKRAVVAELERVVRDDCVIATNTSSLSLTEMFAGAAHPERGVGLHFFNPVAVMPLVEIPETPATDEPTLATAFALAKALGKSAIACEDAPGFVVNRLLNALLQSAVAAVDEGVPAQQVEDAVLGLGLPMGPFRLIELVGPQVALHVARTMADAFPDRAVVPATLVTLAEHPGAELTAKDDAGSYRLTDAVGGPAQPGPDAPSPEALRTRLLSAVAAEVRALLGDGVVDDPRDVDLALLLGAGWPGHLGGITPALRREGLLD